MWKDGERINSKSQLRIMAVQCVPEHWACSCANLRGVLRWKVWSECCVAGDRDPSIFRGENVMLMTTQCLWFSPESVHLADASGYSSKMLVKIHPI
jgi:hypothetical protein